MDTLLLSIPPNALETLILESGGVSKSMLTLNEAIIDVKKG